MPSILFLILGCRCCCCSSSRRSGGVQLWQHACQIDGRYGLRLLLLLHRTRLRPHIRGYIHRGGPRPPRDTPNDDMETACALPRVGFRSSSSMRGPQRSARGPRRSLILPHRGRRTAWSDSRVCCDDTLISDSTPFFSLLLIIIILQRVAKRKSPICRPCSPSRRSSHIYTPECNVSHRSLCS